MRVAMIGLGDIVKKTYLPIIADRADVTPLIFTQNRSVLSAVQKQYNIEEVHTSLASLIKSQPDIAMIHSRAQSHPKIIDTLLTAGIAVFTDKPLCYRFVDCERLLEKAARKKLPLFVGFNRRYAPLTHEVSKPQRANHIRMQKNRTNLPARPQEFIYDDFIHVLDTLRFLAPGDMENIQVVAYGTTKALCMLSVQWQRKHTLLTASMNRISGVDEETLELFGYKEKWKITDMSSGCHYKNNHKVELKFSKGETASYKKGFETMVQKLFDQVNTGNVSAADYEEVLKTHELCEHVFNLAVQCLTSPRSA